MTDEQPINPGFSARNVKSTFSKSKWIVVPIAGAIGAGILTSTVVVGSSSGEAPASRVRPAPQAINNVDGDHITPEYEEAIRKSDAQRLKKAGETGESAVPTMAHEEVLLEEEPVETTNISPVEPQAVNNNTASSPQMIPQQAQVDQKAAASYESQFQLIMESIAPVPAQVTWYGEPEKPEEEKENAKGQGGASGFAFDAPLPGTILYGVMIGEANSDVPGTVLAKVLQGEFKGARLLGEFQTTDNGMLIAFHTMTLFDKGVSVPIDAVAIDTIKLGANVATDVDRHIASKLAITFVSDFMGGLADSITQYGQSSVQVVGESVIEVSDPLNTEEKAIVASGSAVKGAGDILKKEFGNRPTTIKVHKGTNIGILFRPSNG